MKKSITYISTIWKQTLLRKQCFQLLRDWRPTEVTSTLQVLQQKKHPKMSSKDVHSGGSYITTSSPLLLLQFMEMDWVKQRQGAAGWCRHSPHSSSASPPSPPPPTSPPQGRLHPLSSHSSVPPPPPPLPHPPCIPPPQPVPAMQGVGPSAACGSRVWRGGGQSAPHQNAPCRWFHSTPFVCTREQIELLLGLTN